MSRGWTYPARFTKFMSDEWGIHGYENSLDLCLPPLSLMVFRHDPKRSLSSSEPDNIV